MKRILFCAQLIIDVIFWQLLSLLTADRPQRAVEGCDLTRLYLVTLGEKEETRRSGSQIWSADCDLLCLDRSKILLWEFVIQIFVTQSFSNSNRKLKVIKNQFLSCIGINLLIFNLSISFSDLFDVSTLNYQDLQCCDVSDHSSMSSLVISILWTHPGKLEGNYRQPYAHSAANCSNVAYKLVLFYRPVLSGSCLCTRTRDCETSDLSLPMKTAWNYLDLASHSKTSPKWHQKLSKYTQ